MGYFVSIDDGISSATSPVEAWMNGDDYDKTK